MDTALPPADDAWSAWQPDELARRLAGVSRLWCVVGGWALDLWHGVETRPHEDLEFTILRDDLRVFRDALGELAFHAVDDGRITPLAPGALPPTGVTQIWGEDRAAGCWRVDMMLEAGTPETWVYKRNPAIRRPRDEMAGVTAAGIPYLRPEAVLLFKAKYRRDKDEADFARAVPKLDGEAKRWLKACLLAADAEHAWARALD